MYNPVSTYRVQLHSAFGFKELEKIIDYLSSLGIGTFYASPVFSSVKGSTHGYDSTDPTTVNPEIGTLEDLRNCSSKLHGKGMGWLQDIVPNHMAYAPGNKWLMDVLEKGRRSAYYDFFDFYRDPVTVPFLGKEVDQALEDGELLVVRKDHKLYLRYFESDYPLNPASYATLFASGGQPEAVDRLLQSDNPTAEEWAALLQEPDMIAWCDQCIPSINKDKQVLQRLIEQQHYRLLHWQDANAGISYRRFFTINSLISLNIQKKEVFDTHHAFTNTLLKEGAFTGLRIDHIDGLYDPAGYLRRLRGLTGEECYIAVEKILEPGEALEKDWPVQGSTGYDFLGSVNQLLTNHRARKKFDQCYLDLTRDDTPVETQLHRKKCYILYHQMAADLDHLVQEFYNSQLITETQWNEVEEQFREAISALLIYCPVYRYYPSALPLSVQDAAALKTLLNEIKKEKPWLLPSIRLLKELWIHTPATFSEEEREKALHLYRRCMQYSGPLMAKGKEDTLLYTYCRFMGHNEVGDGVSRFGISTEDFHKAMCKRLQQQPHALNATATHDTKMGEDVRARLAVLTDLPETWLEVAGNVLESADPQAVPDANERYFLLQMILGAHPMPGEPLKSFKERLAAYIPKALREAKIHSQWTEPDTDYEEKTIAFAMELLAPESLIHDQYAPFLHTITDHGIINSLVQLLLKCTCPGTPDIYQGSELWDLSLVDPDNRRPVDYAARMEMLQDMDARQESAEALIPRLWADRYKGNIKLWILQKLLQLRKENNALFFEGDYIPLKITGKHRDHVIAFARYHNRKWVLTIAALHLAELCDEHKYTIESVDWADTAVVVPPEAPRDFQNIWTGEKGMLGEDLPLKNIFSPLPIAVLKLEAPPNERRAGVLLAISSLPAAYGIGDLGLCARRFANFLKRSQQRIWQMLPLNPVAAANGYSPYSSISSMACNTLLISPDDLIREQLLSQNDVRPFLAPPDKRVDYDWAETSKNILLDIAFERFEKHPEDFASMHQAFERFCKTHHDWLHDFAVFATLRDHFKTAWSQWPAGYRHRDRAALQAWSDAHSEAIKKVKWWQYVFNKQWSRLRKYCHAGGIELIGDLPFYVNYDSVDVWANPELFVLDEQLQLKGVAGVPPDYFSEDGQLWGMPTFDWEALKRSNYAWWLRRFRRNLELFDTIRLDHFRAFDQYWEVPAGDATARGGAWKTGAGKPFFDFVKKELGGLPFVAEDLGDNMEEVYQLRDAVGLPGMKVLQFAFGEQSPRSVDIPHNYDRNCIVYTGTHDNNTVAGWYAEEATPDDRKRLDQYLDDKIHPKNVHTALSRVAYASIANTVILPMQDLLGLDASFRMNKPGVADGNWTWRLLPDQLRAALERQLRKWVQLYNRY